MTPFLLALLIWLLVGGALYMHLLSNIETGYEVCKELHIPVSVLNTVIKNKRFLVTCLIFGPIALILAICTLIHAWMKGEIKNDL